MKRQETNNIYIAYNDGKRPDGLTLMPWANGRCLLWDFTCSHTLAASFFNRAVLGPSNVVCNVERRKICKYSSLLSIYIFFRWLLRHSVLLEPKQCLFYMQLSDAYSSSRTKSVHFLSLCSASVWQYNAACLNIKMLH